MPDHKGPDWLPPGYKFDAEGNRLERLKTAPEKLPEFVYPAGHTEGQPTVVHHEAKHRNGHFDRFWAFVEHGIPEGFAFREGILVATTPAVPASIAGTAAPKEKSEL